MPQREPLTKQALTGNVVPRAVLPLGAIPVPGYDASYIWQATAASAALTKAALGGRQTLTYPSGGILAVPDLDAGTIVLQAWWAYASTFTVMRVDPDGSRTPVRGAESWPVAGDDTRRNGAANPSNVAQDLTGWSAGTNTTLASLASLTRSPDPQVTTGVQAKATAAGAITVSFPLDILAAGDSTYGLSVQTTPAPSSGSLLVQWYDANGASVGTTTHAIDATAISETAAGPSWAQVLVTGPPVGAVFGYPSLQLAGLAANQVVTLTARLWETGDRRGGRYFDGSFFGANWTGTPGKSPSTRAPVQLITDAEAPLDRAVTYEISNPSAPGYVAATPPVTLSSKRLTGTRQCLLTHPGLDATIRVWITDAPDVDEDIEQTSFQVIGRKRKVVVSAPQRAGAEGSLTMVAETFAERDRIKAMLADGSPLLLRMPARFGYPPHWWLSFGKLTDKPWMRWATHGVHLLTAPVIEVDRPSAATRPLAA